jgi:hypothetical protein
MIWILVLLFVWLALTVLGFTVKALLWLALVATFLFFATAAVGVIGYVSAQRRGKHGSL